jgi:DUF4097 and DUF4098 domain-containing protein YvlB/ElaB/YqjD/DUF883 family membrane-anchored ribosome-binding protein
MGRQKVIQVNGSPKLVIRRAEGELTVRTWERPEVTIRADDEESLRISQEGEGVLIVECESDCTIQAPIQTKLHLERVDAECSISGLRGELTGGAIEGDVQLRNVGAVTLERIEGDFTIRQAQGNCTVQQIEGDAEVEGIQGNFFAESIEGSLRARRIQGNCTLNHIEGDVLSQEVMGNFTAASIKGDWQGERIHGNAELQSVKGSVELSQVMGRLSIDSVEGDLEARQVHGSCTVQSVEGNARVDALMSSLSLGGVEGDLKARQIHGSCTVQSVSGNAAFEAIHASLKVTSVEGDCQASQIHGECEAQSVEGNLVGEEIHGRFTVESLEGDLTLANVHGNVQAQVGGNVTFSLSLSPGQECHIQADGDIAGQIPPDASVRLQLKSAGGILLKGLELTGNFEENLEATLGAGEALLELSAGGQLALGSEQPSLHGHPRFEHDFQFEFGKHAADFAQQVAGQVERQVVNLTRQLDEKLAHWGGGDEIAVRVQEKVQSALRRAEEALGEAMRNAEQRAREAERRAAEMEGRHTRHARRHVPSWDAPPPPPPPPAPKAAKPKAPPVSDEERLVILRMVSEGKISVEQAEQLLAALSR